MSSNSAIPGIRARQRSAAGTRARQRSAAGVRHVRVLKREVSAPRVSGGAARGGLATFDDVECTLLKEVAHGSFAKVYAFDVAGTTRAVKVYKHYSGIAGEIFLFGVIENGHQELSAQTSRFKRMVKTCGIVPCEPVYCTPACGVCRALVSSGEFIYRYINQFPGHWHLSMELMDGNLMRLFRKTRSAWQRLVYARDIIGHLACAAELGLSYCDMKAENCLYRGNPKDPSSVKVFIGDIDSFAHVRDAMHMPMTKVNKLLDRDYSLCSYSNGWYAAIIILTDAIYRYSGFRSVEALSLPTDLAELFGGFPVLEVERLTVELMKKFWPTTRTAESESFARIALATLHASLSTILDATSGAKEMPANETSVVHSANALAYEPGMSAAAANRMACDLAKKSVQVKRRIAKVAAQIDEDDDDMDGFSWQLAALQKVVRDIESQCSASSIVFDGERKRGLAMMFDVETARQLLRRFAKAWKVRLEHGRRRLPLITRVRSVKGSPPSRITAAVSASARRRERAASRHAVSLAKLLADALAAAADSGRTALDLFCELLTAAAGWLAWETDAVPRR